MHNHNQGCDLPLVGYVLNLVRMPPIKGKDWNAFLVKTTEVTKGVDREKNVVEVPIGSEVLIPATYQLTQYLGRAATHEKLVFEVHIEFDKQLDIGAGQKMSLYKIGVDMAAPKLRREFGIAGMLGSVENTQAAQLAAKPEDSKDNIPF